MEKGKPENRSELTPENLAVGLLQALQRGGLFNTPGGGGNSRNATSSSSLDRIIQTAYRLFSERGFEGASVAAIAEESGVNKALIYYYFEDKKALYKEVIDSALGDLLKIWDNNEVKQGNAPHRLTAYLRAVANLMQRNTGIAPLIFTEIVQKGEMQEYIITNYFFPNALNLVSLINEGAEQGFFKPMDNPVPVIPSIMAGLFIVSRVRDIGLIDKLPFPDGGSDFSEPYIDYVLKGLSV